MTTLLEKPVRVSRIVATSTGHARAIEDPARARILEILYKGPLPADRITAALSKAGHKKALTTVRHHLEVLREAGLIEVVRIVESRGAITKHYGTSTKLLDFGPPDDFEAQYSKVIDRTTAKVERVLRGITPKGKVSPEYSQYLVFEIINRAVTNVLERPPQPAAEKPKQAGG